MTDNELRAALEIKNRIDRLQLSLDTLRETGGVGCSIQSGINVQGGTSSSDAGQTMVELGEEIAGLMDEWKVESVVVHRALNKITMRNIHRRLLELRYVRCFSWKAVAQTMGYSERMTFNIHNEAKKIAVDCS